MYGDLVGHRVRVTNPTPEHESARGIEGMARHVQKVEQGGMPTDDVAREINEREVQYYVESFDAGDPSRSLGYTYRYSELEPLD